MSMTKFHEKNLELHKLKKRGQRLMAKFNTLYCEYADWFKRQEHSFTSAVKSVQVVMPSLVPQEVRTMNDFEAIYAMATPLAYRNGTRGTGRGPALQGIHHLDKFLAFRNNFAELYDELVNVHLQDIEMFVASISRLRQPELREELLHLNSVLAESFTADFDFQHWHNEKDNLYTYRLSVSDQGLLGLVGYIPQLVKTATRMCYLITRLNLELA